MILADKLLRDNWRLMSVPEYWNGAYGSVLFTRTNYTTPTVAATVSAPSASVSMEHKAVFWGSTLSDFKTSAENEGVSATDMDACTTSNPTSSSYWYNLSSLDQKCLVELLLSTLAKENWTLTTTHAWGGSSTDRSAYFFTRPVQAS